MKINRLRIQLPVKAALCAALFFLSASAFAQTPFYKGKTVTIIQGRDPGGTGDMRVRAMLPFL